MKTGQKPVGASVRITLLESVSSVVVLKKISTKPREKRNLFI